ncbi:uncharacterized protein CcaverHIS019_0502580 [Cutaneotrichosporon cavernicola]|uniref:Uncharacterized protein n=1 Tax=Cutaneotrichosporon cavernicola TaxID=279322 RepID=A0AA48L650_9TREE|nr:uncharacterized protein CcaverHIS019_0502580 [Cutaneotrichosporon cavernicola]BEI92630.1 hypothetical protein CcaverHIS019_0502580 [Cutaneotrichosporon cavernicola]
MLSTLPLTLPNPTIHSPMSSPIARDTAIYTPGTTPPRSHTRPWYVDFPAPVSSPALLSSARSILSSARSILPLPPTLERYATPLLLLLEGSPIAPSEVVIRDVMEMYDAIRHPDDLVIALLWLEEFVSYIPPDLLSMGINYFRQAV